MEEDASSGPDAALLDASADAAADGDTDAATVACESEADCASDEICSQYTGSCVPRCTAQGVCAGPVQSRAYNRLISDGEHVCYATPDADGYAVEVWDGSAEAPRRLTHEASLRLLLLVDGYCYFSAPALKRVPVAGGPVEVVAEHASLVRRAWSAPGYVWWTVATDAGHSLYRLARQSDQPAELFASTDASHLWEAGNSSHLFRRVRKAGGPGCSVYRAPIDDLADESSFVMSYSYDCTGAMVADEESLFYPQYEPVSYNLYRVDQESFGTQVYTQLFSVARINYQLRGDTIYAQGTRDSSGGLSARTTFYRIGRAAGAVREQLLSPDFVTGYLLRSPNGQDDQDGEVFAVLRDQLIFSGDNFGLYAGRLLRWPLP